MFFNSIEFFLFFAVVFGLYVLLSRRAQNRMLLVASYIFYAAWDWRFLSLLLFSSVVDYWVGSAIGRSSDPRRRKFLVSLSLVSNLGILGLFKYAGFFSQSLQDLVGQELPQFASDIILPVGISFYTFQTLSYTIDVYRGRLEPIRDFLDFALFVSFFPQLVAGPIERASNLLPQICGERQLGWQNIKSGSWLVLWGLYKKVVIADNLGAVVDAVYRSGSEPTSGELLFATYAFAYQIYCDFSGYSDIARGIARMMGFELMLNFRLPYLAANPADFWRRWHISLSTWLRDYLYISLGGNRGGRALLYRNLFLTMLLGGLWHGAAWPFIIWGVYQGLLLMVHRASADRIQRLLPEGMKASPAYRVFCIVVTFHLVCLGWLIFRSDTLSDVLRLLGTLAGPMELGAARAWVLPFCFLVGPLWAMQWAQHRSQNLEVALTWPFAVRSLVYAGIILTILFLGEPVGPEFIYFQF